MIVPGYNTNGFAHHRLADAVEVLFEIGYRSLALTPDVHHLNPFDADWRREAERLGVRLRELGMAVTVESGARYLLDARRKHQPTLVSRNPADRARRREMLELCCDLAAMLGGDTVSLWSGASDDDASFDGGLTRLAGEMRALLVYAEKRNVRLAFEPEPGMLIESMEQYQQLFDTVDHPLFGLTLDLGHLHCLGDSRLAEHLVRYRGRVWNIHIEDMNVGVHDHLMFGEGTMDFARVFQALRDAELDGPVHVELSRHSHDAVSVARRSYEFLSRVLAESQ